MYLGNLIKSANERHKKIPITVFVLIVEKLKKIFFLQLKEIKHLEINLLMKLY